MKALYYEGKGQFRLGEGKAIPPQEGEVRLKVAYCGVCGTDLHISQGAMDARVPTPMVIGHEMSGTVAELGAGVSGFSIGEKVVVRPLDYRGETPADRGFSHICQKLKFIGIDSPGAFQGSWTVPEFTVHKVPVQTDLKMAAFVEPLAVACHDVRLGDVKEGEFAVVHGGGPIGILVALVARQAGARVVLSEINQFRRDLAHSLGLEVVDPAKVDLPAWVKEQSGGSGADIVFEVSGARTVALGMTELLCIRGRIVIVAIHPKPVELNLFHFFWKELQMRGARVYEPQDYDKAIQLISSGVLPLDRLLTKVEPLEKLPQVFHELHGNPEMMKVLIDCQA